MAHPRMYDPEDPLLVRLRSVATEFPECAEVESWGRPTFRAGKKIFAVFGATDRFPAAVVFKPDDDERPALLADPRFLVPPYFGAAGWLALDLTAGPGPVDWDEVRELLDSSYRQVALVRMLRALDAAAASARSTDARPTPAASTTASSTAQERP